MTSKNPKLKKFVVRRNCEYSTLIEADSESEAIAKALKSDLNNWDKAYSDVEAEEE